MEVGVGGLTRSNIFIDTMTHYIIKLSDKAAFLNHMEKQGIYVDSFDIKDDQDYGTFEFDVFDEETNDILKKALKKPSKIDKVKENILLKSQLIKIIREELQRK